MIRIEFPKLLAWFQTHQTVSRPNFQPHRTVDVSNYIQLDAIINPWLVWLDGLDGLDGLETVWTVWKRSDVSGTMPEVSEIQF